MTSYEGPLEMQPSLSVMLPPSCLGDCVLQVNHCMNEEHLLYECKLFLVK